MAKGAGAYKWTQTVPSKHKRKPNLPTACKSSSKRTLAGLRSSLETPVDDQDITEVPRCCMPLCRLYMHKLADLDALHVEGIDCKQAAQGI